MVCTKHAKSSPPSFTQNDCKQTLQNHAGCSQSQTLKRFTLMDPQYFKTLLRLQLLAYPRVKTIAGARSPPSTSSTARSSYMYPQTEHVRFYSRAQNYCVISRKCWSKIHKAEKAHTAQPDTDNTTVQMGHLVFSISIIGTRQNIYTYLEQDCTVGPTGNSGTVEAGAAVVVATRKKAYANDTQ